MCLLGLSFRVRVPVRLLEKQSHSGSLARPSNSFISIKRGLGFGVEGLGFFREV